LQSIAVLGIGKSGKSTVIKHAKILHCCKGISERERQVISDRMQRRLCLMTLELIQSGKTSEGDIELGGLDLNVEHVESLREAFNANEDGEGDTSFDYLVGLKSFEEVEQILEDPTTTKRPLLFSHVKYFWNRYIEEFSSDLLKKIGEGTSSFRSNDSRMRKIRALTVLNNDASNEWLVYSCSRICCQNFLASDEDILKFREPTRRPKQLDVSMGPIRVTFSDVGGQRELRKDWMNLTQSDAVIYVASLDDYCKNLDEDSTQNAMKESMRVFRTVVHMFRESHISLFLNKKDKLEEAISEFPLSDLFPDFSGSTTHEACDYIVTQYIGSVQVEKPFVVHVGCATNQEDMKTLFMKLARAWSK